jgi:hypothetical protein
MINKRKPSLNWLEIIRCFSSCDRYDARGCNVIGNCNKTLHIREAGHKPRSYVTNHCPDDIINNSDNSHGSIDTIEVEKGTSRILGKQLQDILKNRKPKSPRRTPLRLQPEQSPKQVTQMCCLWKNLCQISLSLLLPVSTLS